MKKVLVLAGHLDDSIIALGDIISQCIGSILTGSNFIPQKNTYPEKEL